jgi:hypothetical protein
VFPSQRRIKPIANAASQDSCRSKPSASKADADFLVPVLVLVRVAPTTDFCVQADGAKAVIGLQSTGELLLYPLVEDGCAEAPDLADLQGANVPSPCHPLERLGME